MQDDLFAADDPPAPTPAPKAAAAPRGSGVRAVQHPADLHALAQSLPPTLRMGVSTWSYPGWDGLVWDGVYSDSTLSRKGLGALSQHPLMRTVCVDRSFWRPLSTEQYAQMAAQVPNDFRFVVKCPNVVTDALVRGEQGAGQERNPVFLDPGLACTQFVQPCLDGLGPKLGVLVFQISPLPWSVLQDTATLWRQLAAMLARTRAALQHAPQVIVAVEVRDPQLLSPELAQVLQVHGTTYCLGLHGKMPTIEQQLVFLRQLWPTPLVCRWNLNHSFGPFGYQAAQEKHQPFNALVSADTHTRTILARTVRGITGAGQPAFVTISNDAEGCAPLSIHRLAQQIAHATVSEPV